MISDSHFYESRDISHSLRILPANCLTFDELYAHYRDVGFLYPKKLERLSPHLDLIKQNWERAWSAGRELMWTLAYIEQRNNAMGTVTTWRTAEGGWQAQHLTSQKNPAGVIFLLLSAQDEGMIMNYNSGQNWYSPTNKFAMRIYGGMADMLGENLAFSCLLNYLELNPRLLSKADTHFKTVECTDRDSGLIKDMAILCRGKVYCDGEELAGDDMGLSALDKRYRKYGLSRKRHIWLAIDRTNSEVKGMIIAYRGPFGFNFSFLENRCDVLVHPGVDENQREKVCTLLLRTASEAYFNDASSPEYPISHLVVMADDPCAATLTRLGAVKTRQYNQGVWLRQGFGAWKQYMEKVFDRVMQRFDRQNQKRNKTIVTLEGGQEL
ncbi:MAG: hypothetical protein V1793_10010 [Pseudomonadota bacterium]